MKKVIIGTFIIILVWLGFDYLYYYAGILYIPQKEDEFYFSKAEEGMLWISHGEEFEEFEIRGVNLGLGKPGFFATETAITKEEYLRWFEQIQNMGANIIRVYTVGSPVFYEAFYEYNVDRDNPLYLIHGVWVDDYLVNNIYSAVDEEFYKPFLEDCKQVVDVIHGRYKCYGENDIWPEVYDKDVSQWVYALLLGIEWETTLVSYTDYSIEQLPQYMGEYLYTEDASNFEIFLASIGDAVIGYESEKYGGQRLIAFSNWPTTDPLIYNEQITAEFHKAARVDVEHIKWTEKFHSGQFASYHIYPYYPDYYSYMPVHEENTYREYLTALNQHHQIPVVISEFGVPSSRGQASVEGVYGRHQGGISETQQGESLILMYQDIMEAGCNGGIVFSWQDEWFKRTWNTWAYVNLKSNPYWSDYQTNEQYFGLLSFDPGEDESICYVDGCAMDWDEEDIVLEQGEIELSMKFDEKFIYFLVRKSGFEIETDTLYIPLDSTPKSGTCIAERFKLSTSAPMDFVIEIKGREESRVWVHERYDIINALFYESVSPYNFFSKHFPEKNSNKFNTILMLLHEESYYKMMELGSEDRTRDEEITFSEYQNSNPYHYYVLDSYETGLLTYGNANPSAEDFNSLADFCAGDGFVEIKIPWQLLNFADPSNMYIHDDYYEVYGVEYLQIDSMKVGAGTGEEEIQMVDFELEPLGKKPEYHERLKESYYILKEFWTGD